MRLHTTLATFTLLLTVGLCACTPLDSVQSDDPKSHDTTVTMRQIDRLLSDAFGRETPDWEYRSFSAQDSSAIPMLDACVTCGIHRLDIVVQSCPSEDVARENLARDRASGPAVAWRPLTGVGDECIAYDECGQAWVYLRRGRLFVKMRGRRNEPPSMEDPHTGPGVGCSGASTELSKTLLQAATGLVPLIDRALVAAQLAHAAERAQRDRASALDAVARAR